MNNFFNEENYERLYNYFIEHTEYLCDCCANYTFNDCLGKEKCPDYHALTAEEIEAEGLGELEYFFTDNVWSCLNTDNYRYCKPMRDSECAKCLDSYTAKFFIWNGKVK